MKSLKGPEIEGEIRYIHLFSASDPPGGGFMRQYLSLHWVTLGGARGSQELCPGYDTFQAAIRTAAHTGQST